MQSDEEVGKVAQAVPIIIYILFKHIITSERIFCDIKPIIVICEVRLSASLLQLNSGLIWVQI